MKKKYFGVLLVMVLTIIFAPSVVLAENTSVNVYTNGFDINNNQKIATIDVEENVTTISNIKQTLATTYNFNVSNYIIVNYMNRTVNDNDVVCGSSLTCYNGSNGKYVNIYLKLINSEKLEIELNSIPPTNEDMFYGIYETNYDEFNELSYKSCNEEFTNCVFENNRSLILYDNVVIKYIYDKNVKNLAESIIANGLLNKTSFKLTDTEILNFINYGGVLADYSSEFKDQLRNLNFRFEMDPRGGSFDPFETASIGFYKFMYKNTLYGVKEYMEVSAPHILYIPTNTSDVKKAIEDRLNIIFGDDNHITVTKSSKTINELLDEFGADPIDNGNEYYYILISENENSNTYGMEYNFIVVKDSSKINNSMSFKQQDLVSNISIITNSNIPLDTLMYIYKITSGSEYDKLLNILKISDGEIFDISLKSISQNKLITRLENGKFLVKIPIPEKYEGKNLVIYYVNEDNEVISYDVTIKDGYAVFETDHFSTYTLVATNDIVNPKTYDDIVKYFIILGICVVAVVGYFIYIKKKN